MRYYFLPILLLKSKTRKYWGHKLGILLLHKYVILQSGLTIIDCQACRGSSASGGKNSSNNKMVKQAALAFVKWTLERYHQFEDTGKSCFSEPLFKDMFLTASSQHSIVRQSDGLEADSSKLFLSPEATTGS